MRSERPALAAGGHRKASEFGRLVLPGITGMLGALSEPAAE